MKKQIVRSLSWKFLEFLKLTTWEMRRDMRKTKSKVRVIWLVFLLIIIVGIIATLIFLKFAKKPEKAKQILREEDMNDREKYYWDNTEVIEFRDVQESKDLLSETSAITLMDELGFTQFPTNYERTLDGEYVGEREADGYSAEKHALYTSYYISANEEAWTIHIVENKVFALPLSFMEESVLDAEVIVSETEELVSHEYQSNRFYTTIPKNDEVIVHVVDKIDAQTLDFLTVDKLKILLNH